MSRRSHAARRPRGRWTLLALIALLLLVGAWLGVRASQIRSHLMAAKAALGQVSTSRLDTLPAVTGTAQREVSQARRAADDPVWRLAAAIPVAGRTFAVGRDATQAASTLVDQALPAAARAGQELRGGLLQGGTVDLARLQALRPEVDRAAAAAARARDQAQQTSSDWLPGPVLRLRSDLIRQTQQLADGLGSARTALALAPGMLGADGPRRYFVAVQNNAESRGTGGLVGAYAVLRADNGRISRERVGTNADFRIARAPVVDLGPQFSGLYDQDGARVAWSSAVLTPDWPSAAAIMAGLWKAQGGGPIDGVIGVDPRAMADILAVTGPATVGGQAVGANNVVDFVMRDEYAQFENANNQRKVVLAELAGALYDRVLAGKFTSVGLVEAVAKAGGSGHLQLWSSNPAEQSVLQPLRVGGALTTQPGPYLEVVMNNAAGNKADYYVRRHVAYQRRADGTAQVQVTLTNHVVPTAVPPVVTLRADKPQVPVAPGATRFILSIYAGVGQRVRDVLVDGQPVSMQTGTERGHGVGVVEVEVAPSAPTTVTATVTDPGGTLVYRQQPLVVNDTLDLRVPWRSG